LRPAISRSRCSYAGEWRAAVGDKSFDTEDPSTGKLLAKVSDASAADIETAVAAARKALPKWSAASGYERAKVLYAIGRAMQRHQRLFAVLESLDNGKPIRESRDIDVPLAIRHFIHHAGWAQSLAIASSLAASRPASSARSSRGTFRC
jgi:aldehyde dehydrogenase (NAD+)